MLIYHPAYDAYHCIFRSLLITGTLPTVEEAKLRILDFFLCFPAELQNVRLPVDHSGAKALAKSLKNVYHGPLSKQKAFRDMEHIQIAAFRTLAASGLLNAPELETGLIRRTGLPIPPELTSQLQNFFEKNKSLVNYLLTKLADIPLLGKDGLKHRTGLMEYRYDNV
ncbi:ABC-three component system middle component 5 [Achromobacter insolitus]|uniref:ABC-three component system middle component 5 n=1 Tax=Achromobacter insolitus TaxID=217204 RepID=UPI001EEF6C83|nr:ABC-three component system middle component 5 [Achromobacter insolitus]